MNSEIKQRIEQIKGSEIPEGYHSSKAGLCPDDWDSVHLYQIAEPIVEQAGDGTYETLSISAGIGFVNQAKKFGKELSGKQYEKYTVLNRGDFSYNKGNSKSYPQGCIYRLKDRETAAVPNVFESFRVKRDNSDYYEQLFISGYLNKQLSKKINHGVRDNGLLNLTEKDFYSCYIPHPSVTEQQKIAGILMQCDKLIELYQREVDELQKLKKTCLHKMFPKKGENVPECRFKGFTDVWEQRKLSEVAEIVGGGTPSTNIPEYWDGDIDWYAPAEINDQIYVDGSERKITKLGLEKSSAKILPADKTVLFTSRAGIGKTAILRRSGATNQGFQSMVLNDETNPYFVFSMSKFIKEEAERVASGSTFAEVSGKMLGNLAFMFPAKKEQDKIGEYFSNLDNLITLHQRKAEEMKKQKKSLMQLLLTGIVRVKL